MSYACRVVWEASRDAVGRLRCCRTCRAIYRNDFARCPIDGGAVETLVDDPLLGTTIGSYLVEACIGEGSFGRVYRAHHARLERRQVALKVLLGDFAASLSMRLRFALEAEAASRLDHPNVASVVDFGKTPEGLLYLAMELVDGPTLLDVIEASGPLPLARVHRLAVQLCLGLGHAHQRGLIHRDFKPSNVIVVDRPTGEVARIVDFGLAIVEDAAGEAPRMTTAGTTMGTPAYAAPEQVLNAATDHRADLFALGVTLYEMLTGKVPFEGGALELMHQNATMPPPPISQRAPGVAVPPRVEALIHRLMQRRPEHRFTTAEEVIAELGRAMAPPRADLTLDFDGPTPRPTPSPLLPATRPGLRRLRAVRIGAIAGLTLAAAATAYVVADVGDRRPPPAVATAPPAPPRAPAPAPAPAAPPEPQPVPPSPAPPPTIAEAPPPAPDPRPGRSSRGTGAAARRPRASRDEPATPSPRAVADVGSAGQAPLAPAAAHAAPPPRPPAPVRRPARTSLEGVRVEGPLADAVIRRALDRVRPALATCWTQAPPLVSTDPVRVRVRLAIGETRRASSIVASPTRVRGLAACVAQALRAVRADQAPDVGDASVALEVVYAPEVP